MEEWEDFVEKYIGGIGEAYKEVWQSVCKTKKESKIKEESQFNCIAHSIQ
jgi:hypothetical protein